MNIRPVYWALCGAGVTLLASAWGNNQDMKITQNQNDLLPRADATSATSKEVANDSILIKRQPWANAKTDPFSRAVQVTNNATLQIADKVAIPKPQPPAFPYVFIGRLLAEEKDAAFLSKDSRIYTVAAGDVLEGIYRIEHVGNNELEMTYLPDHAKMTIAFDTITLKPVARTNVNLSQANGATNSVIPSPVMPSGMVPDRNNVQKIENQNQTPVSAAVVQGGVASTGGVAPAQTGVAGAAPAPAEVVGAAPGVVNGPMTSDLQQMLTPTPPPQGDALNLMGSTPPPQGDALQIMGAHPPQPGQTVP